MDHVQWHLAAADESCSYSKGTQIKTNHFQRHQLVVADESRSRTSKGTQEIKTNRFQWHPAADEELRSRSRNKPEIKINHFQWHVVCSDE